MALHFSQEEYEGRIHRMLDELQKRRLDGTLIFKQESMYYLTGFDTLAYIFFQCLYIGVDGNITLFTRLQDVLQAEHTSIIKDVHIWVDREGVSPAEELRSLLESLGCRGKRLGIEYDAHGLTYNKAKMIELALEEFCLCEDVSDLVTKLRAVKSPQEIAYIRKATQLADEAFLEANKLTVPGIFDGDLLAAIHGTIFKGGGGYPANECILNSGPDAILVRHHAGRRNLTEKDQINCELAASYRRYHSVILRTILIGDPNPIQRDMYKACQEALAATEEKLMPGVTMGQVFDAHANSFDSSGFQKKRLNACGYGLGATFPPTWVDWPMLYTGNPTVVEPNMVLVLLMILLDTESVYFTGLGRTVVVTESGCESLSSAPLELPIH